MNVPSFAALGLAVFFALLLCVANRGVWRKLVLFLANICFLGTFTHSLKDLLPLLLFLGAGFVGIKAVERWKQPALLFLLIAGFIAALFILKKYPIVPAPLIPQMNFFTLGLSYIFFRVIHLIIDTFQEMLPERIGLLSYLNYTLNFTTLISGPVQLYPDYRRTASEKPLALDWGNIGLAFERMSIGFFKVSLLAPYVLQAQQQALATLQGSTDLAVQTGMVTWLIASYAIFLYANFSGYTDFVIGMARLLRMELPENFQHPFMSSSFSDFWGHWHMTLSHWLKTYVYAPLLLFLIRRYPAPDVAPYLGVLTFFVTFGLMGIWHGATSAFLFYGFLQGFGISIDKLYQLIAIRIFTRSRYKAICAQPLYISISRGLTFTWFSFSLIWFWGTWNQLGTLWHTTSHPAWILGIALLWLAAALVLSLVKKIGDMWSAFEGHEGLFHMIGYSRVAVITVAACLTLSYEVVFNAPAPVIIYKAF